MTKEWRCFSFILSFFLSGPLFALLCLSNKFVRRYSVFVSILLKHLSFFLPLTIFFQCFFYSLSSLFLSSRSFSPLPFFLLLLISPFNQTENDDLKRDEKLIWMATLSFRSLSIFFSSYFPPPRAAPWTYKLGNLSRRADSRSEGTETDVMIKTKRVWNNPETSM